MSKPLFLLVGGGHSCSPNSRNLGDMAQLEAMRHRLVEEFGPCGIVVMANAVSSSCEVPEGEVSHRIADLLLTGQRGPLSLRRLRVAIRAALFLVNAKRVGAGKRPLRSGRLATAALSEIRQATAVVVHGSGVYCDDYALGIGTFWAVVIRVACLMGVPVVCSGQQVGPLSRRRSRLVTKWALRSVLALGVRDLRSLDVASELGLRDVVLTGDDAWALEAAGAEEASQVLAANNIDRPFVAVQIRFGRSTQLPADRAAELARALDELSSLGRIVFVPMHYGPGLDDRESARVVASMMLERPVVLTDRLTPRVAKAVLSRAHLAIGTSNHFCVFAASAGVPTIAMYFGAYMEHKLAGLAQMYPRHVQATNVISAEAMHKRFREMRSAACVPSDCETQSVLASLKAVETGSHSFGAHA